MAAARARVTLLGVITGIQTAWLYAYSSSSAGPQTNTYFTVFTERRDSNGREVLATISLSYLTTLSQQGAGALVRSYTPPFGPPVDFTDFKHNSVYAPNAIAVTYGLGAKGAEAYAQANLFYLD